MSLLVYNVETYVADYKYWIHVAELKKYINVVTLNIDLEIQDQTRCNAFNVIYLVVYIVDTCFWYLQVLNRCRKIQQKYISILWPWRLTSEI